MSHDIMSKVKVTRGHWNNLLLYFNVIEWPLSLNYPRGHWTNFTSIESLECLVFGLLGCGSVNWCTSLFLTLWNQLSNKNQIWYHQVYCWILLKYTIHTYAKYTNMINIYLNKKTVILSGHINSLLPSTGHHMPIWNYFIIIVSSWI